MAATVLPLFANLVVPLVLVVWMAGPWVRSRVEGMVLAVLVASYAGYVVLAGPIWGWVGMWVRWVPVVMVVAGLAVALRRWPGLTWMPRRRWTGWVSIATQGFIAAVFAGLFATSLAGLRAPDGMVRIGMPLAPGAYLVLNGGATAALNGHNTVQAQRYALDVLGLNEGGRRASGLRPAAVTDYAIYGRAILAPCDGTVLSTADGAPDTPIGGSDAIAPAGNHVTLLCEIDGRKLTFLLAHMVPGSVAVTPGQRLKAGETVGRVGSSGNSSEPHLHIHAIAGEARIWTW